MKAKWKGKRVAGILTVLPEDEFSFEDTILADNLSRVRRLKKIMGFDKRRRVKENVNASDVFLYGMNYLISNQMIKKDEIGAIVVVTLTPDYFMPQISMLLHKEVGLKEDVICVDIAQGCAGYIIGLIQSFMLLEHMEDKKVVLFTGDVLNRQKKDEPKTEEPAFGGDAFTVTVIENDKEYGEVFCEVNADGYNGEKLIMPCGAFKHPVFCENDAFIPMENGLLGNGLGIWMNGSEVFNFIVKEVPPLIESIIQDSGLKKNDIEKFFFHQPNRYILEKVAAALNIHFEKIPMNVVEKYGNSNSSTIPVTICDNVTEHFMKKKEKCCLSGFGSGLTWAAIVMDMGCMDFCEIIESKF